MERTVDARTTEQAEETEKTKSEFEGGEESEIEIHNMKVMQERKLLIKKEIRFYQQVIVFLILFLAGVIVLTNFINSKGYLPKWLHS